MNERDKDSWSIHALDGALCLTSEGCDRLIGIRQATDGRTVFVLSDLANSLSSLSSLIEDAIGQETTLWAKLEGRFTSWSQIIDTLSEQEDRQELISLVKNGFGQIEDILKAVWLVGDASGAARKFVDHTELSWLMEVIKLRLSHAGFDCVVLDSSRVFVGQSVQERIHFDYELTERALSDQLEGHQGCDTLCVAGGWVKDSAGRLLDGFPPDNELIAAACANLLDASSVSFWNPDSFVTTAECCEVPGASVIEHLTYEEATELSFFGAKVIHPQAFVPAMVKNIPLYLKNFCEPDHSGTRVSSEGDLDEKHQVKGFSVIHDVALINIEGAGMIGVPGVSSRLFSALRDHSISVILISQASSEHSICFAVPAHSGLEARKRATEVFAKELEEYRINSIELEEDCAILAAVGQRMPGVPGIAAKFFGALGKAQINVRAIAQGSSERNISAVIRDCDATKALRALHAGFFLSNQTLSIGVIGPGLIGQTLLAQISAESARLRQEFGVDLRVRAIANSRKMLLDEQNIELDSWKQQFETEGIDAQLDTFADHVAADYFPHSVLIDCSTSSEVPKRYLSWIRRGIHIITPNKKAGTAPKDEYELLMRSGRDKGKHFLYETTVGAGLPIIGTLKDLIQTGDRIRRIEGVFSGTLAYLFWRFDGTVPFSQLVREAKGLGYTEPDPRDDLSGMDIVRKAVILAREVGMEVEIDQVPVLNLVPKELEGLSVEKFLEGLDIIDQRLLGMQQAAASEGKLLKYVGIIDPLEGICTVELKAYEADHPFARISGTDNIVAFTTDRYNSQPLVIQGPGAGPDVTAGGVFADLLRLSAYLGARF